MESLVSGRCSTTPLSAQEQSFSARFVPTKFSLLPKKLVAWPTRIQFVEALAALAAAKRAPFTLERAAGVARTGVHQRRPRLR